MQDKELGILIVGCQGSFALLHAIVVVVGVVVGVVEEVIVVDLDINALSFKGRVE